MNKLREKYFFRKKAKTGILILNFYAIAGKEERGNVG